MKFILFLLTLLCIACTPGNKDDLNVDTIDIRLNQAIEHVNNMAKSISSIENVLPKTTDQNGQLITSTPEWWTSGFYPGTLWYLYEFFHDEDLKKYAHTFSMRVENQKYTTDNHDVGFMLYCSFGNGFRLTNNSEYEDILTIGAHSLMTRYSPKVKLIKSWDTDRWQFPVIIDNMMNLELIFDVAKRTGDSTMYASAINHADQTIRHHFRPDYSCWHLVGYDTINAEPYIKQTHQGLNDSSSWARGQAWALYGYTMTYRETQQARFLHQAQNIANYIINHPSIPADKIPLWDFDAPSDSPRDASAAAIIASALIELSEYSPNHTKDYLEFAKDILVSLSSDVYFAKVGTNGNFILKHSTGNFPGNIEVDVPLSYADYYYVEALMRYRNLLISKEL